MPVLERLRPEHAAAVLAFERENRAYFAASVPDRGDAYFDGFSDRFGGLLAEQAAGVCAFHVLGAEDGAVLGRFNLYDLPPHGPEDGAAEVGYRVAEHVAGRGVATTYVRELCRLAASRHGLRTLRAAAAHSNPGSQRVLEKAGFIPDGPANPSALGGRPGTWYRRELAAARE